MTRRDTILIAVLVNIGLLIVLFITSVKPTHEPIYAKVDVAEPIKEEKSEQPLAQKVIEPPKEEMKSAALIPEKIITPVVTIPQEMKKPPEEMSSLIPVIVKQGDVLEKIAKTHQTTVEEVMKINRLPNAFLKIGQVLYIPAKSPSKSDKSAAPLLNDEKFYIVKNGDNPWTIASKNHIKIEELLRLNQLDEESARKLKPGDKLRIR